MNMFDYRMLPQIQGGHAPQYLPKIPSSETHQPQGLLRRDCAPGHYYSDIYWECSVIYVIFGQGVLLNSLPHFKLQSPLEIDAIIIPIL